MQIITKPKTLVLTVMVFGLSSAACAGDQVNHTTEGHTSDVSFIKADSNEDNLLSREEFKIFAALEAEAGVAAYAAMNEAGNEDLHFSGKDIDGDGLLTKDELAYSVILNDEPSDINSSYESSNSGETVPNPVETDGDDTPAEIEPTEE